MVGVIPDGFESVDCPGCGGGEWEVTHTGHDWVLDPQRILQVVRCNSCGLHFTNPRPVAKHIGAYYESGYTCYQQQRGKIERSSRASTSVRYWVLAEAYGSPKKKPRGWRRAVAMAVGAVKPASKFGFGLPYQGQGRWLDFGCGGGTFLRRMASLGWTVAGMDISAEAVAAVRAGGMQGIQGSLPHPDLSPGSFDVITMRHSLEHVPNPKEVIAAAFDLLASGGRLVINVPCYNCWDLDYFGDAAITLDLPRHLTHFTQPTLRNMLISCGFAQVEVRQVSRAGWFSKALDRIHQRGEKRRLDYWLRFGPIRRIAAMRAKWTGGGNELFAMAQKP
jgi:2-polyprenyl-3-methyl-5-hydroxy-6-metoxy-1,4-benzoquinol methylase